VAADPAPIAIRLAGQDHALEPGRDFLLGSAGDCDLCLGPGAAAHHARLRVAERGAELEDLGSAAGTFRNGERIGRAWLQVGDVLRFGDVEAAIVPDAGEALVVPLPHMRAAATRRRTAAVRQAASALLRRRDAETFGELMAGELRRAPWLLTSALLHLLLLLLLLALAPTERAGGSAHAGVVLDDRPALGPDDAPAPVPEVVVEAAEPAADVSLEARTDAAADALAPAALPARPGLPAQNPRLARRAAPAGARDGSVATVGSSGFRRAVADLQKSGLEIVFVFDSTGSMSRTIHDTKHSIAQMLGVLRTLVPQARVGIVTYRDRGPKEEYLVKQVPLVADFWRLGNFVQSIAAEGGGDRPEDVRAGLRAAFAQAWRRDARRVVVLAGDAPPHADDLRELLRDVREFARNGRSFVHALVTSPESAGADTQETFAAIAEAGRGTAADLQAHERVLQRVLTLAFGREFDQDVAAVIRAVEQARERAGVQALDLARRGGPDLARALLQDPVPADLLDALVRRPRRAVAEQLVGLLGASGAPEHTRHAAAWALLRILDLPLPPVDPCSGEPLRERELARLRRRCGQLRD
jgi:hypothetical protein